MEVERLEELVLEYLSSQLDPFEYDCLCSRVCEENEIEFEELKVQLWLRLYSNPNVLILISDEFEEYIRSHFTVKKKKTNTNLYDIDLNEVDPEYLGSKIGSSRLICSNSYRIRSLNLVMYDQVTKSTERFRLLMAIASKRYSGYWQSDLAEDLNISHKDIFSLINSLVKLGLVYKFTIPQDRISKYLLNNMQATSLIKFDQRTSQEQDRELTPRSQNSASICFFHKYFMPEKLPEHTKKLVIAQVTRNFESTMLERLEKQENSIMLDSDWKRFYFNVALQEVRQLNAKVDNYLISRSYLSFRKSMELKSKVALIFAWCPQTNKFERCVMLLKNGNESQLKLKTPNVLQVINIKNEENEENEECDYEDEDETINDKSMETNRHSLQEYIYSIIKMARNGISAKEINKYVPIKYKQLTKIIAQIEALGILKKEMTREGKVFMYRYFTANYKRTIIKREAESENGREERENNELEGSGLSERSYREFVQSQKNRYLEQSDYARDFEDIFGNLELPKQVNTLLFKSRMVLMHNYVNYFKAGTFSTIANFYWDMESSKTKADRKSVMRVSEFVTRELPHFKKIRCEEIKGTNMSLTIIFDSRHYTKLEAYKQIRSEIDTKRNIVSTSTSKLKNRINDHFKNLEEVNQMEDKMLDIMGDDKMTDAKEGRRESELDKVNIQVPCLIRNISVNQEVKTEHEEEAKSFSQKLLSLNGYVFPIMTRTKMLHQFLGEHFGLREFKTKEVVERMTLEKYFQIIGCGYELPECKDLGNERIEDLPEEFRKILLNQRRDPLNIINNNLNFLYRIKLIKFISSRPDENMTVDIGDNLDNSVPQIGVNGLEVESSTSEMKIEKVERGAIEWKLEETVELYEFKSSELVGRYKMMKDFEQFWQNFKIQVDNYINSGEAELPLKMQVKEVFVKKNWKKTIYLSGAIKGELDELAELWLSMACNSLHQKSLTKIFHIPYDILSTLTKRFNLNNSQIQGYIQNKIKFEKEEKREEDDRILNKIINNINKDKELMWISRYVIAEKIINQIFLNKINNDNLTDNNNHDKNDSTTIDLENGNNGEKINDVWECMKVLLNGQYKVNECKTIFDYIINKSSLNMRIMKRLRRMKAKEIIKYIENKSENKNSTTMVNLRKGEKDDQRSEEVKREELVNKIKLKYALMLPATKEVNIEMGIEEGKTYRQLMKKWVEKGWIVKSKKRDNFYKKYKLSNSSKLKLLPRYSSVYHMANQLIGYMELYNEGSNNNINHNNINYNTNISINNNINCEDPYYEEEGKKNGNIKNCLEMDYYKVYNVLENFNRVQFEPKWNYILNRDFKFRQNTNKVIDGGISRHIKLLTNDVSIGQVKGNISKLKNKLRKYNYKEDNREKKVVPKLLICENEQNDIINPVQLQDQCQSETSNNPIEEFENLEILQFKGIKEVMERLMETFEFEGNVERLERMTFKLVELAKKSENKGISDSEINQVFNNNNGNDNEKMVKILVYTAVVMRLLVLVPNGEEFKYFYWEFTKDLLIKSNSNYIGNNTNKTNINDLYTNNYTENIDNYYVEEPRRKPEYIPETLWMIWESNLIELRGKDQKESVGEIKNLVFDSFEEYLETLKGTYCSPFVTSEGRINEKLTGFVLLNIYSIVREKPGITAEQVWENLAILDQCEVQMLIEGLVTMKVLKEKEIQVKKNQDLIFTDDEEEFSGVTHKFYYPQETSYVLWKFKNILITH